MGKQAGRGNHKEGMTGAGPGELAVPCALCPIPGVNLPEGWESLPDEEGSVIITIYTIVLTSYLAGYTRDFLALMEILCCSARKCLVGPLTLS
jgi:hypothetical protein